MPDLSLMQGIDAVTFMVAADLVFTVIAAFCSSPQTAEINAAKRSATLMKWVWLGLGASGVFVLIAAGPMKGGKSALLGGGVAGVMLGLAYVHANKAGLANGGPSTESY